MVAPVELEAGSELTLLRSLATSCTVSVSNLSPSKTSTALKTGSSSQPWPPEQPNTSEPSKGPHSAQPDYHLRLGEMQMERSSDLILWLAVAERSNVKRSEFLLIAALAASAAPADLFFICSSLASAAALFSLCFASCCSMAFLCWVSSAMDFSCWLKAQACGPSQFWPLDAGPCEHMQLAPPPLSCLLCTQCASLSFNQPLLIGFFGCICF